MICNDVALNANNCNTNVIFSLSQNVVISSPSQSTTCISDESLEGGHRTYKPSIVPPVELRGSLSSHKMFTGRGPPGPPPNGPPGQPPLGPPGGPLGPGMTQGGPGDGAWNPAGAPGQGDASWQSPAQPLPGLLGALGGGLGGGGLGVGVGMGLGPMIPPVLPPGGPGGSDGGGPPPLAPPVLGPGASPPHGTGSSPHSLTPPGRVDLNNSSFMTSTCCF